MKQRLLALLLTTFLLAACAVPGMGVGPTPTPLPTMDVDATINAMSATMIAGTLTAQPTATPLPTDTPTVLLPTDTPAPSATPSPTTTMTPEPFIGCFARGPGHPPLGVFRIENNTKETLLVYLNGTSFSGNQEVSCSFTVTASFNTEIIFGKYQYSVQIGKKSTKTGEFSILSDDKTTMRVYDKKVVVVGP